MAEINNSVALGIKPPESSGDNGLKTITALSQLQLSQAHAGLYSLEAAKQGMLVNALQKFQQSGDPNDLAKAGQPDLAEKYVGFQKGLQDAKSARQASDATYVSSLPPEERMPAFKHQVAQHVETGLATPLEGQQALDMAGKYGVDTVLKAFIQHGPQASTVAQELPGKVKQAGLEAEAKAPSEIKVNASKIAAEGAKESGTMSNPGVGEATGAFGAAASRGATGGQPQDSQPQQQSSQGNTLGDHMGNLEKRYNLPNGFLPTTFVKEGTGQNPNSSASGGFQFIDSTAKQYGNPDRKDNFAMSEAAARLAADNMKAMQSRIGHAPDGPELYLGHHFGAAAGSSLLNNPQSRAGDILGKDAKGRDIATLNGFSPDMRAGDLAKADMNNWSAIQSKHGFGQGQAGGGPQTTGSSSAATIGIDPGTQKFLTTVNEDAAKDFIKEGAQYKANGNILQTLSSVDHDIDTLGPQWMGTEANRRQAGAKAWNTLMSQFPGGDKHMIAPDKVAAGEALTKDQINGGMANMVSKLGLGREAASIVKMGQQTFPGNEMSYQGAKFLSSNIKAAVNYQRAQYEYKADLVKQAQLAPAGSQEQRQLVARIPTADTEFAKQNPPDRIFAQNIMPTIDPKAKAILLAHADDERYQAKFNEKFGGAGNVDIAKYVISDAAKATQRSTLQNGQ